MRRGINHKRINLTLDEETLTILLKYRSWGTPFSALVRKAVKSYDFGRAKKPIIQESPEEASITYD